MKNGYIWINTGSEAVCVHTAELVDPLLLRLL